jgi:hypothetical protein
MWDAWVDKVCFRVSIWDWRANVCWAWAWAWACWDWEEVWEGWDWEGGMLGREEVVVGEVGEWEVGGAAVVVLGAGVEAVVGLR